MLALDIHTGRVRTLLEDVGDDWIFGAPCVSPDKAHAVLALSLSHPEIRAGGAPTRPYVSYADHRLRLVRVPLAGGEPEILFERQPAQSAHCAFCPADGNLLYFDLDLPPRYREGATGAGRASGC